MVRKLYNHAHRQHQGKPGNLDSIEGQEVTIIEAEIRVGRLGKSAEMTVVDENGETHQVRCTGFLVVDAIENLLASMEEAGETEFEAVTATFVKRERTWIIQEPA